MGTKAIALDYMMDNGMVDNTPKTTLANFDSPQSGPGGLLTANTSSPASNDSGTTVRLGGNAVYGTVDPGQSGMSYKRVEPQSAPVVTGSATPNNTSNDGSSPGTSSGDIYTQDNWLNPDTSKLQPRPVYNQDDWLNPDVSKLKPDETIIGSHPMTPDEAGQYATVGGYSLTGLAAIDPEPVSRVASAIAGAALLTDGGKDEVGKLLTGLPVTDRDPQAVHLQDQINGYSD